jgi:hypothetical protein
VGIGIVTIPRQLLNDGATSMINHVTDVARRVEDLGLHGTVGNDSDADVMRKSAPSP